MNQATIKPPSSFKPYLANRWDATLTLFANVLFAVSLLVTWGLLTLIGVLITQERDAAFYFANFPTPFARMIMRLGLDHIYHGPAYLTNIGFILASLAVCTFKRVIPARIPALRPIAIEHIPLNASIHFEGDEQTVRSTFEEFLKKRGWSIRKRDHSGIEWTYADKHDWARRGVLLSHLGFVILAVGTCVYWARGFSGHVDTLVGNTAVIPQTGARLQLNEFHDRIDPIPTKSGLIYQPIDYVSTLLVTDAKGKQYPEILRVNHPIDLNGVLVYQATFGVGMHFRVEHLGKQINGPDVAPQALMEGQTFTLPGTERIVRYTHFVGTIGTSGMPTADPRPNNPGAVIDIFDGDNSVGQVLVPLNTRIDLGGGYMMVPDGLRYYSGFDYRFDPGIPIVGLGAFVLLAGFCICLYLLPARLHARFAGEGTHWTLSLAATTVKGYEMFESQFTDLVAALKRLESHTS
jgi:cytochrome c biogenesis protein